MTSLDSVPPFHNVGRFYIGFSDEVAEVQTVSGFKRLPAVRDWLCAAHRNGLFSVPVRWLRLVNERTGKALRARDVLDCEATEYRIVVRQPIIEVFVCIVFFFVASGRCLHSVYAHLLIVDIAQFCFDFSSHNLSFLVLPLT